MDGPKTMFQQAFETKKLYNAYQKEHGNFKGLPGQETALSAAMAPFLHSVLDLGRCFWANTQSETERNLLRQFADELKRIYK